MVDVANIREWRGHKVIDADGHKIGKLEAIYVVTGTDLPAFGTVAVGMLGRERLLFVPLDRATVGPGYLNVFYDRKLVRDAPSIEIDGELPGRQRGSWCLAGLLDLSRSGRRVSLGFQGGSWL